MEYIKSFVQLNLNVPICPVHSVCQRFEVHKLNICALSRYIPRFSLSPKIIVK